MNHMLLVDIFSVLLCHHNKKHMSFYSLRLEHIVRDLPNFMLIVTYVLEITIINN